MIETTPKIRFVDLGEKTLDGLGDNHRVFEVVPSTGDDEGSS
jgi:hypothetical protein